MKRLWCGALALLVVGLTALGGCAASDSSGADDRIGVVVTIAPQVEFVERVGGDKVEVCAMVLPGFNPHIGELKPSQIKALAGAEMYFKVGSGVEFELVQMVNLEAANRDMQVFDCSEGVGLITITGEEADDSGESDGEEDGQHHGVMDPHIWMSPLNAQIMVRNICDGLISIDPENRAYYEDNRDAYLGELTQLDQDIREGLSDVTKQTFIIWHPFLGYFAHDYGLTMLAVEEEGDQQSGPDTTRAIEVAQENGIKFIFDSPQSNHQGAETIARAIGGKVLFIDPLAGDYAANLGKLLDSLVLALR